MTIEDKAKELEKNGFIVGKRDPRLNTAHIGNYMVCDSYDESELPTQDGANGPWCIVGDDLSVLINEAYDLFHREW